MKQSFLHIYSFYALMLFSILLIPALIFYLIIKIVIPYKSQIRWIYVVNKSVMLIWSPLAGIRYECIGKENIERNETYISVFNHLNFLDVFAINRHYAIPAKPLIKKELLRIPILGWLFRMTSIPIERTSKESKSKGMQKMLEELSKDISILIFPEGTRNRSTNPLSEFKNGAFILSAESKVKILPGVIMNTRKMANANKLMFLPGKIKIQYLPAIDPAEFNFNMELIKQHCFTVIEQTIQKFDNSYENNSLE